MFSQSGPGRVRREALFPSRQSAQRARLAIVCGMTTPDPDAPAGTAGAIGRGIRAARTTDWKAKAKQAAAALKADYQAGKQGDEAPAEPIWPSASDQFEGVVKMLRAARSGGSKTRSDTELNADADDISSALRNVDWNGVRTATAERTSGPRKAMRDMADQVEWSKVQPVAAQVSSALIAAVAAGQIPMGGLLGSTVVRTIMNQGGLAQRVADNLSEQKNTMPPDFRGVIDTTARDS